MQALTLKHPWVWAVCYLGKRIENRTWKPPAAAIGQYLALHGGVPPRTEIERRGVAVEAATLRMRFPKLRPPEDPVIPGVAAVFKLRGFVVKSTDPWFDGPVGWLLGDVTVLPRPVSCKGLQGLWELPPDVLAEVRDLYREARRGAKDPV